MFGNKFIVKAKFALEYLHYFWEKRLEEKAKESREANEKLYEDCPLGRSM